MNLVPQDDRVIKLQEIMRHMPQVELETFHFYADGMYCRVVPRPKGTIIVGKVHKKEHFYIVAKGCVKVIGHGEEEAKVYPAGSVIISKPGTKRAVFALEDSICLTVHRNPTGGENLEEIEKELVEEDPQSMFGVGNKLKALT